MSDTAQQPPFTDDTTPASAGFGTPSVGRGSHSVQIQPARPKTSFTTILFRVIAGIAFVLSLYNYFATPSGLQEVADKVALRKGAEQINIHYNVFGAILGHWWVWIALIILIPLAFLVKFGLKRLNDNKAKREQELAEHAHTRAQLDTLMRQQPQNLQP